MSNPGRSRRGFIRRGSGVLIGILALGVAAGSLVLGNDWLGRGALSTSSSVPTYEQVNTALTGGSAPYTASETIGGVTVSVSSGKIATYGPGGTIGGVSTRSTPPRATATRPRPPPSPGPSPRRSAR